MSLKTYFLQQIPINRCVVGIVGYLRRIWHSESGEPPEHGYEVAGDLEKPVSNNRHIENILITASHYTQEKSWI